MIDASEDFQIVLLSKNNPNELKAKLVSDPDLRSVLTARMTDYCRTKTFDAIAGPEAGAFPLMGEIGHTFHKKLVFIRKARKPSEVALRFRYYNGKGGLIAINNVECGERILLVEDDLMTGGTIAASAKLIEQAGGIVVGIVCAVEWPEFYGRRILSDYEVFSSAKAFSSLKLATEWMEKCIPDRRNSQDC